MTAGALVVALVLLAESFGRDVWWLWSHRVRLQPQTVAAAHAQIVRRSHPPAPTEREPRPACATGMAAALTILAALLVWAALVAPDQPQTSR